MEQLPPVGESLGNEISLAKRFDTSRTTIRTALNFLESHDCVKIIPRKGVFLKNSFTVPQPRAAFRQKREEYLYIRWCDSILCQELGRGFELCAREHNINVATIDINSDANLQQSILTSIPDYIKGIIILPSSDKYLAVVLNQLVKRGIKVVQVDRSIKFSSTPSLEVAFDNYSGAVEAVKLLLTQHKQPVYFCGYREQSSTYKRYMGWYDTMCHYGYCKPDEFLIDLASTNFSIEYASDNFLKATADMLEQFLSEVKEFPISIFAVSDHVARVVYQVAEKLNLRPGKDIYIIGFDDLPFAAEMTPPLTSIKVDRQQLGRVAAEMLFDNDNFLHSKLLPVELIVRASSGGADALNVI